VRRWSQILDTKRPVVTCPAFAGRRRGCCEVSSTAPPTTKKARAGRPGFFCKQECERAFPQKHALGLGPRVIPDLRSECAQTEWFLRRPA